MNTCAFILKYCFVGQKTLISVSYLYDNLWWYFTFIIEREAGLLTIQYPFLGCKLLLNPITTLLKKYIHIPALYLLISTPCWHCLIVCISAHNDRPAYLCIDWSGGNRCAYVWSFKTIPKRKVHTEALSTSGVHHRLGGGKLKAFSLAADTPLLINVS